MLKLFILNSVSYVATLFAVFALGLSYWGHDDDGYRPLDSDERQHIKQASAFVEQAQRSNGQLPTPKEFLAWSSAMDAAGFSYDGKGFTYVTYGAAPSPQVLIQCFGEAPLNAFGFSFWTGEELVTVASWQKDLHLACNDGSDYLFGRPIPTRLIFAIVGVILLVLATWLQLISDRRAEVSRT